MQKRLADFVTGFGIDPEGSTVWGKPVGITSDPAGNLYISSDQVTNAVFRIEPGPLVGAFEHNLPNTVANGSDLPFRAAVTLSRFSSSDLAPTVTADLSSLGGSAREPFAAVDGGGYRLEFPMKIDGPVGAHPLIVRVEQVADGQTNELKFNRQLVVLPAVDVAIYDDDRPAPGWHVETETGALALDADGAGRQAFQVALETFGGTWGAGFVTAEPVDALGYASLAFAFRADAVEPTSVPRLLVRLNGLLVDLIRGADAYRIDFAEPDWQIIEIPLQEFTLVTGGTQGILPRVEPVLEIDAVHFIGNLTGTFRLDDVRVVTAVKAAPPSTLVREPEAGQFPAAFELAQNYPNPFNAETVIRYSLAARAAVHVSVYNLAGQRLLTLVDGERPAGTHTITWDGRDEGGASRCLRSLSIPHRGRTRVFSDAEDVVAALAACC